MKKITNLMILILIVISMLTTLISFSINIYKASVFNTLVLIKSIDLHQIFIGFSLSFSLFLIINFMLIFIHILIKENFPHIEKQSYNFLKFISDLSIPISFIIWMLLSLKEKQFNILTSILATTALMSDLKIGKFSLKKNILFSTFFDDSDDI